MPKRTLSETISTALAVKIPLFIVLLVLALAILACRPQFRRSDISTRSITVHGIATITSEPDEYIFYPQYSFTNVDPAAALKEATAKNTEITDNLRKLGVADKKIKFDTSGFQNTSYYPEPKNSKPDQTIYNDSLTVTVGDKRLAQKVQDYLVSTSPTGSISPQAGFSENLKNRLEVRGRNQAAVDARAKADQSAKNLGFRIGAVKSVEDGSMDQNIRPYAASDGASPISIETTKESSPSLAVQSGENKLTYMVTVVFYLR